jgi:hypothetical protein
MAMMMVACGRPSSSAIEFEKLRVGDVNTAVGALR